MSCRRYGSKPTIAFWMLIATVDAAALAAADTAVMISILLSLALIAGGVVAARTLTRRSLPATNAAVRRRA
jgi:hypothetical protein